MQYSINPPVSYGPMYIDPNTPAYRVLEGKFFADSTLFEAGTAPLYYTGEPNLSLEPLNDLARKEFKKFIDRLNKLGQAVKKLNPNAQNIAYPNPYEIPELEQGSGATVRVGNKGRNTPIFAPYVKSNKVKLLNEINTPEYMGQEFAEYVTTPDGKSINKDELSRTLNDSIGKQI